VAPGFTQVDLHAGYRHGSFDLALELENPGGAPPDGRFHGCEDIHFTPAYPFTIRFLATLLLD
jgi:hypothetical protein